MLDIKADYRNNDNNIYLFNNDCLKVLEVIPDNSIDLIVTDCPYRVMAHGGSNNPNVKLCSGILKHDNQYVRQGKIFKNNDIKFNEWLPLVYEKLKDNSHCYIFINGRNLAELQIEAEKVGFKYQQLLVWDKRKCYTKSLLYERCRICTNAT
jgi:site-specific DNA-methyltransferase (adenine-specific)